MCISLLLGISWYHTALRTATPSKGTTARCTAGDHNISEHICMYCQ